LCYPIFWREGERRGTRAFAQTSLTTVPSLAQSQFMGCALPAKSLKNPEKNLVFQLFPGLSVLIFSIDFVL
jgi:hypothetical protein